MYEIDKSNIQLDNYLFSIGQTHRQFLLKDDHKGLKNPSDTRSGIMDNLGKSMRYIHEVMKVPKNLKENEIYRIFNAPNLELFFSNLLNNSKYDLRTSEIARIMVEIGLNYLRKSEKFKDNKNTLDNINNIISDFRFLSESIFSEQIGKNKRQEGLEMISSPLWKKIENKIKEIEEKSPIPIDEFIDIKELKKILIDDRPRLLQELFAVQNKIEFNKSNSSEKEKLRKIQSVYRKELDETDRTLEGINDKQALELAKTSLLLNPHQDLELYLSSLKPISAKTLIQDSKYILKKFA